MVLDLLTGGVLFPALYLGSDLSELVGSCAWKKEKQIFPVVSVITPNTACVVRMLDSHLFWGGCYGRDHAEGLYFFNLCIWPCVRRNYVKWRKKSVGHF